jgi:hypothetical protein
MKEDAKKRDSFVSSFAFSRRRFEYRVMPDILPRKQEIRGYQ